MTFKAKLFDVLLAAHDVTVNSIEVEVVHVRSEDVLAVDLADETQFEVVDQDVEVDEHGDFEFMASWTDDPLVELVQGCAMVRRAITEQDLGI